MYWDHYIDVIIRCIHINWRLLCITALIHRENLFVGCDYFDEYRIIRIVENWAAILAEKALREAPICYAVSGCYSSDYTEAEAAAIRRGDQQCLVQRSWQRRWLLGLIVAAETGDFVQQLRQQRVQAWTAALLSTQQLRSRRITAAMGTTSRLPSLWRPTALTETSSGNGGPSGSSVAAVPGLDDVNFRN